MVKELRPLRTMSHVEGTTFSDEETHQAAAATAAAAGAAAAAAFAASADENSCALGRPDAEGEEELDGTQQGRKGDGA